MTESTETDLIRIAFVCVQNAGRSQMAFAFAQQKQAERGLEDNIDLITGGTQPAEQIHDEALRAMHAVGIDISDQTPREVTFEEIQESDYVITMGCSAEDVCPAGWAGENQDWNLEDPDGKSTYEVEQIRDKIEQQVKHLFDEVTSDTRVQSS